MTRILTILMLLSLIAGIGCHHGSIHPAPTFALSPLLVVPRESAELRNLWIGRRGKVVCVSAYYQGYDWTTPDPRKRWLRCFELKSGRMLRDERITYDPTDALGIQTTEAWDETLAVLTLVPTEDRFWNAGSIGAYGILTRLRGDDAPLHTVQVKRASAYALPTQLELKPRESVGYFDGRSLLTFRRADRGAIVEKIDAATGCRKRIPVPENVREIVSNGAVHICLASGGAVAIDDVGQTLWTDPLLDFDSFIGPCAGRRSSFVIRTTTGFEIRSFSNNAQLAAESISGLKGIDVCCADDICAIRCRPDSPETLERTDWEGPLYVYRAGDKLWSGTGNWSPRILRTGTVPIISGLNWVLNAVSGDRMGIRGEGLLVIDETVLAVDQSWGLRTYQLPESWR